MTDKSNILLCTILACCSIGDSISDHNSMSEQAMSDGEELGELETSEDVMLHVERGQYLSSDYNRNDGINLKKTRQKKSY